MGDSGTLTPAWTATDATSGVASTTATLDGKAIASGTSVTLYELTLGQHTLVVTSTDNAGNVTTTTVTFTVGTSFDDIEALINAFVADGTMSAKTAASLKDRLFRAEQAAQARVARSGRSATCSSSSTGSGTRSRATPATSWSAPSSSETPRRSSPRPRPRRTRRTASSDCPRDTGPARTEECGQGLRAWCAQPSSGSTVGASGSTRARPLPARPHPRLRRGSHSAQLLADQLVPSGDISFEAAPGAAR